MAQQLAKLRPVGRLEQLSTMRHYLRFYYNVAIAANYTLPDSFTLPIKDYICKACEVLIGEHPILTAVPIGEDTKEPYFARLPNVDLSQSVSFQKREHGLPNADDKDAELESLLNKQHNIAFELPLPFWRLCVLTTDADERQFTLVFVFHHAIADGTSGKVFHRSFLRELQSMSTLTAAEVKQVIPSPSVPLLPNWEAAHPCPVSYLYLATELFKAKVYNPRDKGLWTGSKIIAPLETKINHIVIPAPQSSTIKDRCRENKTTITAVLQTIVARALFAHLPDSATKVKCSGAMSTRRWIADHVTDDSMGVWVQEYHQDYIRNELSGSSSFPWAVTVRSRATIQKALSMEGYDASANLLKYVDDLKEFFVSKVGQQRGSTFEVSNIGVFGSGKTAEHEDAPRLGRVVFSQSAGSEVEWCRLSAYSNFERKPILLSVLPGILLLEKKRHQLFSG
ncbi:hypothetical protein BBP40_007608 [Aspergillus hancockii]|nr:hypothetical protein BBP40_007608 [Aspergillus hancockii]